MLNLAKDLASKAPPGGWVYSPAYDNLLQGGDLTMAELDAVSKTVPIMVYYINMHTATANRHRVREASHKRKSRKTSKSLPGGGHFGRDSSGKLDGMIYEETALKPFLIGIPKITPEIAGNAVVDWLKTNAAAGNTTVHEAGVLVFGNLLESYERVAKQTPCRASISLMYDSMAAGDVYKKRASARARPQCRNAVLALRHQDRRRRLQPDADRRADGALSQHHDGARRTTTRPS